MTEALQRRHGLESFLESRQPSDDGAAAVEIQILSGLGHINLRGDGGNAEFTAAAGSVLGQELPITPNTLTNGDHCVYWLGPNEWLVVTDIMESSYLMTRLHESLVGQHASVTDLTGGQVAMRLAGSAVRDVLAKGCTLDLHASVFKPGNCAQTGLAKANALIGLVDDASIFDIIVRRSFAEYLVLWLEHAAWEYGVEFTAC